MTCNRNVVGVTGPLTGDRSAHASLLHQACARLRGTGIAPLLLDDRADPATALEVARCFVSSGVCAVIGHLSSACAELTRPIYADAGIPLLAPTASKDNLTDLGGVFRLCPKDSEQTRLLAHCVGGLQPLAFEVAIDGSSYSDRLLTGVANEVSPQASLRVVHVDDIPAATAKVRLVLATCQGAIRAHRAMCKAQWAGRTVFSDDAHINAFAELCTDHVGMHTYVVGDTRGFEHSIDLACDLVSKAAADRPFRSLSAWLQSSGLFSEQGELLGASWTLFKLGGGREKWIKSAFGTDIVPGEQATVP